MNEGKGRGGVEREREDRERRERGERGGERGEGRGEREKREEREERGERGEGGGGGILDESRKGLCGCRHPPPSPSPLSPPAL